MKKLARDLIVVLIISYVLMELAAYVFVRLEIRPDINAELGVVHYPDGNYVAGEVGFDPINGYRVVRCPWRYMRVTRGTLIFDTETCMNDAGFRDEEEFHTTKPRGVQRVVVLGDSFTHMWYADRAWPDMLEAQLSSTQVYNLALAGTGIQNWYSIYYGYLKTIEYDVLVIAIYDDDMTRGFTVLDVADEDFMLGRFDQPPADRAAYKALYAGTMQRIGTRLAYSEAEEVSEAFGRGLEVPLDFYFTKIVWALVEGRISLAIPGSGTGKRERSIPLDEDPTASLAEFSGPRRAEQLEAIVSDARAAGIRVLLVSVPGKEPLLDYLHGRPQPFDTLLRRLAEIWDVDYVSGYAPFDGVPPREIQDRFWLENDGHWSEAGADRVAGAVASHLRPK